jgi:uncharacterized protein with ParB-like and HNH nuclease domain
MEYQHWTIKEAMKRITDKRLYLPAIQRKFVWGADQIEKLFDSIMRDYPIGAFLFWMVEKAKQNDYSFYEFIRDYHERDKWKNELAAKPHLPDELIGVLDGQQRLNSMYVALQGTYAYKRPRVWWNNPNAFPVRRFYINVFKLEREEEEEDFVYEFLFLTADEAVEIKADALWFQVKDLLHLDSLSDVRETLDKRLESIPEAVEVPKETRNLALRILEKLWERLNRLPVINYFPVTNQNLDEILDIFVRVNSAGITLSKTDLLFSTIVAQWEQGRETIEKFQEQINSKGNRFWFDTDFIMRACLVLADCPIRLKVASFKSENVKLIVKEWPAITAAIERAVDLLVDWGFQGETLTSANAVIPIADAIKRGYDLNKTSVENLRLLLIKTLLTGIYGSQSDQVLSSMRKAVGACVQSGSTFDIGQFESTLRLPGGKSVAIHEETLDELLLSTKGPRTFALLSLLTPQLKFHQIHFHQDHIHPFAGFGTAPLRKLPLTDEQIEDWQAKCDALPNLHLLEGKENQSKQATPFATWLKKEFPKPDDAKNYLQRHHISHAVSLELAAFDQFFEDRKALLIKRLANLLNVPVKAA